MSTLVYLSASPPLFSKGANLAKCWGMLLKVLARLGFPPKIVNLVRVFHENVTLEVDLDDDGNTIIIKYDIVATRVLRSRTRELGSWP